MKYVTFEDSTAVLFSDRIIHSTMAVGKRPMGAGFCSIRTETDENGKTRLRVVASGYSDSIGIGQSPFDERILTDLLNSRFADFRGK